jgi:hypothetical protein
LADDLSLPPITLTIIGDEQWSGGYSAFGPDPGPTMSYCREEPTGLRQLAFGQLEYLGSTASVEGARQERDVTTYRTIVSTEPFGNQPALRARAEFSVVDGRVARLRIRPMDMDDSLKFVVVTFDYGAAEPIEPPPDEAVTDRRARCSDPMELGIGVDG